MTDFIIATETSIPSHKVADLMVTAFEGGSNYWLASATPMIRPATSPWYADPDFWATDFLVKLKDDQDEQYELTPDLLQAGFNALANKYPSHARDLAADEYDADTADALLQCALFGDITYG